MITNVLRRFYESQCRMTDCAHIHHSSTKKNSRKENFSRLK